MDLDHDQLRALRAAVEGGTLEAAARALHVTPSAVSQRLRALEVATGRVLLVRRKPVRPTPSGRTLLRLARQLDLLAADAATELGAQEAGRPAALAVAVNADSLATWLLPALAPIAGEVALELVREDEGRTTHSLTDGEVVAAVATRSAPVPGCTVAVLGAMRYRPMASPAFAARWFPEGATTDALARAPVVDFDRDDPLQRTYLDRHAGPDVDPPTHRIPSSHDYTAAVRLGYGWGMVPELHVADDDARLVPIDADGTVDVALHWHQWRLRTPSLDRLADAVVAHARRTLRPAGP